MMTVIFRDSLNVAMAVHACFMSVWNDGSDARDCDVNVTADNVESSGAYRYSEEEAGLVAWVLQNKASDEIRVMFGMRADKSYDFDGRPIPNDETAVFLFQCNQPYQAAEAIHKFFDEGNLINVENDFHGVG